MASFSPQLDSKIPITLYSIPSSHTPSHIFALVVSVQCLVHECSLDALSTVEKFRSRLSSSEKYWKRGNFPLIFIILNARKLSFAVTVDVVSAVSGEVSSNPQNSARSVNFLVWFPLAIYLTHKKIFCIWICSSCTWRLFLLYGKQTAKEWDRRCVDVWDSGVEQYVTFFMKMFYLDYFANDDRVIFDGDN